MNTATADERAATAQGLGVSMDLWGFCWI